MSAPVDFATLAGRADVTLDRLALSLAAEFRAVDAESALAELDDLGRMLGHERADSAREEIDACRRVLGDREGFVGDTDDYDAPENSMLDLVLARRRGLPILLSVVYAEVARRAGMDIQGVGLSGHFVVGHFGTVPPILFDPFAGGRDHDRPVEPALIRAWRTHETALRMLNNLVGSYRRRGDLGLAIRAARLRLALPVGAELRQSLEIDLRRLEATLN